MDRRSQTLRPLAEWLVNVQPVAGVTDVLDAAIRSCLTAIALGWLEEASDTAIADQLVSYFADIGAADIPRAMMEALASATLGAAADLDPLDAGPAHLALPATSVAAALGPLVGAPDLVFADAVRVAMEIGSRVRGCLRGVRPGIGFHSAGTVGTIAAAAAAARLLELSVAQADAALRIALTRASGLAVNNASTAIGLTHFGWAAAHGIESAWLAKLGYTASPDVVNAFATIFPGSEIVDDALDEPVDEVWSDRIVFKLYPCNIYLNPVVDQVATAPDATAQIFIDMPQVRHLDNSSADGVREARNSAQLVAAIARLRAHTYQGFTRAALDPIADRLAEVAKTQVSVRQHADWPTSLSAAKLAVSVGSAPDPGDVEGRADLVSARSRWTGGHALALVEQAPYADTIVELNSKPYLEASGTLREVLRTPR